MERSADLSLVRITNYKAVWSILHKRHRATIPQLAREVGLSLPAVTRAVEYGLAKGLLHPVGLEGAERGRKAQVYELNASYMHFLLIVADNGNLYYQVHDLMSSVLQSGAFPVEDATILSCMERIVSVCMKDDPLIAMLTVALPGIAHGGRVIDSWAYPSLNGLSVTEHFSGRALRNILFDNDMHVAALAARCYDDTAEGITVVFSFGRQSYGAGVLVNGAVLQGDKGAAGEIGDLPLHATQRGEIAFYAEKLQALIAILNPGRVILYAYDADLTEEMLIDAVSDKIRPYVKPSFVSGRNFIADCFTGLSLMCERELKSRLE